MMKKPKMLSSVGIIVAMLLSVAFLTLPAEVEAKAAEKERERQAAIEREEDADRKKIARKRAKVLEPLEKSLGVGRKYLAAGLKEKSPSKSKRAFEGAAAEFTKLLGRIDKEMKKGTDDPALIDELTDLEASARKEAVRAFIDAGNVALARGSRNEAMEYAQKALAIDPDNSAAKSFMNNVQLASAMSGWGRRR